MGRLTEQAALVALLRERRRGWRDVTDRVEEAGSATAVWQAQSAAGQGALFGDPDGGGAGQLDRCREEILDWQTEGLRLVTLLDPDYPAQLLTVHQRPPLLFYRGELALDDARGVAVVGTRQASADGLRRAADIAAGLAHLGRTVISGLAAGIDTAAHRAALAAGGRTVAVIGCGLRRAYPTQNAPLQQLLGREHLVLSQFWPDAAPSRTSFPMRNAVMSGYAAATVVIEAPPRSGARSQARLALTQGRPLFLLDNLLAHDWAREYAGRPGVTVVATVGELLGHLDELLAPPGEINWG